MRPSPIFARAAADRTRIVEQLAIAQQIEALQAQQQQIAATHQQYVNMGMIQPQQHLPGNFQMQGQMSNVSPHTNQFQFPQQLSASHLSVPMNAPSQPSSHRRNQSALPNVMGPPPAPSSGASGFGEYGGQQGNQSRENINPRGRGGGGAGSGHTRRHSLALPEAKKAAELAEQKRKASGFQFPLPSAGGSSANRDASPSGNNNQPADQPPATRGGRGGHGRSQSMAVGRGGGNAGRGGGNFQFPGPQSGDNSGGQSDFQRRGSQGHGRSQSRNFDGNWRQPQNQQPQADQNNQAQNMGNFNMNQTANAAPFQPGHRTRGSVNQSIGSIGNFQYPGQPQLVQLPQGQVLVPQQMFGAQGLNPLQIAHLQALQAAQMNGGAMGGLQASQHAQPQMAMQQQQQQRKTLFTPYLPQATLPALLSDGQLVAGILRVNKKNRSDAYVTTTDLDADIFICGSKDRNRALEGDLVAVELLDVDEVWGQKREKEEKKKRKDNADPRGSNIAVNDATTQPETSQGEGGIRRRGSLRQRPTQKKNDDVEVEGQSLLLMEEEEINDEQKPLYAGHIVAVIERVAGQMFSG